MKSTTSITVSTLIVSLAITLIAAFGFAQPTAKTAQAPAQIGLAESQIVFVLRHADTDPKSGSNPSLNAQGQARAIQLANMIQDEQLNAIYVTNTNRSIQTAAPSAAAAGIAATIYPPFDASGLATSIRASNSADATLIIAHSNTVPTIIAALGGPALPDLEETSFDHFYAVLLKDGRHVRTVQLRY